MADRNYHLRQMEFHSKELQKLDAFGDDDLLEGTVLYFEKAFIDRGPRTKRYKYVAMKVDGVWYTCGPKSPGPYSWDELVDFMSHGVPTIVAFHPESVGVFLDDYRGWQRECKEATEGYA